MEFQSSEMWTIPGWVHVGVTCQSNIHIPHIVTRSLHLLWFSRHCRSVAHDERAALAHQCSECCTSLHVCQRGLGERHKYVLRAKRAGATQAEARCDFRDLTHTTVQHSSTTCAFSSSVMDLRGFNASFGGFFGILVIWVFLITAVSCLVSLWFEFEM